MKKFLLAFFMGLGFTAEAVTQYEQVKQNGKPFVGNVTIVDPNGNTGGTTGKVEIVEEGYAYAVSVTLTTSTAWTRFSLSTTAGVSSSFRGTFRFRITNAGATSGFWWENNLHAAPLFSGNEIESTGNPIQVDDAAYDSVVHWRSDGITTGFLVIWIRE